LPFKMTEQSLHPLLPHCARLESGPSQRAEISRAAATVTDWPVLITQAEQHNLGPLVYSQLRAAAAPMPTAAGHKLRGLVLRHRHANRVRAQILAEVLAAYRAEDIEVLLLKGAALAHMVYPQPGLRPMRDIDLLVKPADLWRAQTVLANLNFIAPQTYPASKKIHHHLSNATKTVEGLAVNIEVHHNVFMEEADLSLDMGQLTSPPLVLKLPNGTAAQTLGGEDMLWHLCHHVANISQPFRFIWVVDVVAFAEMFCGEIDWPRIRQQYPRVLQILSLFHAVTPLSERLRNIAGIAVGHPPPDIGHEFDGWPRHSVGWMRRHRSIGQILYDTLLPPEWWLRLYYGVGTGRSLAWTRWGQHPLHIAGLPDNYYARRLLDATRTEVT
jgi:hypothetical protein